VQRFTWGGGEASGPYSLAPQEATPRLSLTTPVRCDASTGNRVPTPVAKVRVVTAAKTVRDLSPVIVNADTWYRQVGQSCAAPPPPPEDALTAGPIRYTRSGATLTVRFDIRNTGAVPAESVPSLDADGFDAVSVPDSVTIRASRGGWRGNTARLLLRPIADADADALFALHSNAYVLRYWDAPPWTERSRADQFIAACRQVAEEGTGARVAIERVDDGTFVGWCGLTRWNRNFRSASLGYCLDDAAWGHGYATEAARALVGWAFDSLDLNRVQAEADTRNVASARVLEKVGFVREGTLREDCIVDGVVSDTWVFGLLRRDWYASPGDGGSP
jgi:RimJ/RimL family protein N-acetyltransferase